jgi:hypothetical protein
VPLSPEIFVVIRPPALASLGRDEVYRIKQGGFDLPRITLSADSVQGLIDAKHQVIVHGEAFGNGQNHGHIPPMLTGALENLQSLGHEPDYFNGKILTANSNYHTQVNLKECQELG